MNNEKSFISKLKSYLIFAGPATFAFLVVMIVPCIYGLYLTFTNWDGISATHAFVGFANYVSAFKDKDFITSFVFTVRYAFFAVILTNVIAFLLAYVVTSGIKGQNFFRAGFFTPNLIGGVLLGLIWQFLFNNLIVYIGTNFKIPILSQSWLSDPTKAFWALVIIAVWQGIGYQMIIYVAGFMNVPKDVLEAASIDGASGFQKMKSVILPLMIPSFTVTGFLTIKGAFMAYDTNLALTAGGPYNSTEMISMHIYNKAFLSQQYGTGQAEAFVLFAIVSVLTFTQVYISKKLEVEA